MTDANKSYESMGSQEDDDPHYNYDSDGEPPTDQVGDKLTVIPKGQCTKTILEVGESGTGKPGRPYIVQVNILGYFAIKTEGASSTSKDTASTAGCDQIQSSSDPAAEET